MLKAHWHHWDIETPEQAWDMVKLYRATTHKAAAFDTETDGLHIIYNNPFLFQWGWVTEDLQGHSFVVDLEVHPKLAKQVIEYWHRLVQNCPVYLAHNVKFDLHMLTNWGLPYKGNNLSDTMFYIRYGHNALTPENGGPPMQLKPYAAQYIAGSAKAHEKLLDVEKSTIAKHINNLLRMRLQKCGTPPAKYNAKSYTLSVINEMFKDKVFSAEQLPPAVRAEYYAWLNDDVPLYLQGVVNGLVESDQIPYNKLNRNNIKAYGHKDIVWVLETYLQLEPVVKARGNTEAVKLENKLIYPLLDMERVGFEADRDYLLNCKENMREYILQRRSYFYSLAGEEIKVGQHARIKQLLLEHFGVTVEGTDGAQLEIKKNELIRAGDNEACVEFIKVLEELRTLEKWYPTYILRFLKDLEKGTRLYTTINQVGTVSGRVTSDFQQFPKDAIKTIDGVELFQPRKMIKVDPGERSAIVYLDFSQIELRFQALYTILVGHPDTNLCRAYMPYNCVSEDGTPFDYSNPNHIKCWSEPWFYAEDPTKTWVATDVHGATTKAAFGITEEDPAYHSLRYVGKRVNFAKNYGAQYKKICSMFPERSPEECHKIDAAYYTAFPGVKEYHSYCYNRADYAYTTNLFGIRYYGVSGHKLINMLVQGSAAFYLKLKILELYEFSKKHNLKTKWQMQVHDELSWVWHPDDDPAIFFEFKRIMEDWPDGVVPIVAEMEVTTSTWAEKGGVHTLEELQQTLRNSTRS